MASINSKSRTPAASRPGAGPLLPQTRAPGKYSLVSGGGSVFVPMKTTATSTKGKAGGPLQHPPLAEAASGGVRSSLGMTPNRKSHFARAQQVYGTRSSLGSSTLRPKPMSKTLAPGTAFSRRARGLEGGPAGALVVNALKVNVASSRPTSTHQTQACVPPAGSGMLVATSEQAEQGEISSIASSSGMVIDDGSEFNPPTRSRVLSAASTSTSLLGSLFPAPPSSIGVVAPPVLVRRDEQREDHSTSAQQEQQGGDHSGSTAQERLVVDSQSGNTMQQASSAFASNIRSDARTPPVPIFRPVPPAIPMHLRASFASTTGEQGDPQENSAALLNASMTPTSLRRGIRSALRGSASLASLPYPKPRLGSVSPASIMQHRRTPPATRNGGAGGGSSLSLLSKPGEAYSFTFNNDLLRRTVGGSSSSAVGAPPGANSSASTSSNLVSQGPEKQVDRIINQNQYSTCSTGKHDIKMMVRRSAEQLTPAEVLLRRSFDIEQLPSSNVKKAANNVFTIRRPSVSLAAKMRSGSVSVSQSWAEPSPHTTSDPEGFGLGGPKRGGVGPLPQDDAQLMMVDPKQKDSSTTAAPVSTSGDGTTTAPVSSTAAPILAPTSILDIGPNEYPPNVRGNARAALSTATSSRGVPGPTNKGGLAASASASASKGKGGSSSILHKEHVPDKAVAVISTTKKDGPAPSNVVAATAAFEAQKEEIVRKLSEAALGPMVNNVDVPFPAPTATSSSTTSTAQMTTKTPNNLTSGGASSSTTRFAAPTRTTASGGAHHQHPHQRNGGGLSSNSASASASLSATPTRSVASTLAGAKTRAVKPHYPAYNAVSSLRKMASQHAPSSTAGACNNSSNIRPNKQSLSKTTGGSSSASSASREHVGHRKAASAKSKAASTAITRAGSSSKGAKSSSYAYVSRGGTSTGNTGGRGGATSSSTPNSTNAGTRAPSSFRPGGTSTTQQQQLQGKMNASSVTSGATSSVCVTSGAGGGSGSSMLQPSTSAQHCSANTGSMASGMGGTKHTASSSSITGFYAHRQHMTPSGNANKSKILQQALNFRRNASTPHLRRPSSVASQRAAFAYGKAASSGATTGGGPISKLSSSSSSSKLGGVSSSMGTTTTTLRGSSSSTHLGGFGGSFSKASTSGFYKNCPPNSASMKGSTSTSSGTTSISGALLHQDAASNIGAGASHQMTQQLPVGALAHQNLFDEIIRRNATYGPLLTKIKTAYDAEVGRKMAEQHRQNLQKEASEGQKWTHLQGVAPDAAALQQALKRNETAKRELALLEEMLRIEEEKLELASQQLQNLGGSSSRVVVGLGAGGSSRVVVGLGAGGSSKVVVDLLNNNVAPAASERSLALLSSIEPTSGATEEGGSEGQTPGLFDSLAPDWNPDAQNAAGGCGNRCAWPRANSTLEFPRRNAKPSYNVRRGPLITPTRR
ncbi:unnamed protein product [Amoebophrya sp. A25]|nr:unnamed protein product [Amoebophrya sp. A25]|eukprot:GSA25T00024544001.1